MLWQPLLANLCFSLLFAALLLWRVRRFDRRMDALDARMEAAHEERMRKADAAHAEFLASFREESDRRQTKILSSFMTAEEIEMRKSNGFHGTEGHDADAPRLDSSATP